MGPETRFKTRALKDLRALPGSWWVKVQQVGIAGTPDILGCVRGHFVAVELKATVRDKPTKLQAHNLASIKNAGGWAVVTSPEIWPETLAALKALALTG